MAMVCMQNALHEKEGNYEYNENGEDNSDSYKQGVECWNLQQLETTKIMKPRTSARISASQTCLGANVPSGLVPSTFFLDIFGHSWGLVYGEGGTPGTVPLRNLRVTSHVLHQEVPLGWYRARLFELFLGVLRGLGEGAPLVRYPCKTQKSLHGRHVWETLRESGVQTTGSLNNGFGNTRLLWNKISRNRWK